MKKGRLLPRSTSGQSLVELAVSLVVLLYLLGGAVEFGIIFFQFVQLRDAAQEGALYGSVCDCPVAEIDQRARAASNSPIDLNDPTLVSIVVTATDANNITKDPEAVCEADAITVRATYNHQIFMPFVPQLIGRSTIPLNASVTDTVLTPVCGP